MFDLERPYAHVFLAKMDYVRKPLNKVDLTSKVINLVYGERILVRKYRKRGMDILGLDLKNESRFERHGDMLNTLS